MYFSPLNQRHRPRVPVPRHENKVYGRTNQHPNKDDTRPVEVRRRNRRELRPETPEEGPEGVRDGESIDGDAEFAQAEFCMRQGFGVADPAPQEAADREAVALEEGDGEERGDGVEGDGGADVDESEADADGAGEDAGICWDMAFLVHFGDPWAVSVSGKWT